MRDRRVRLDEAKLAGLLKKLDPAQVAAFGLLIRRYAQGGHLMAIERLLNGIVLKWVTTDKVRYEDGSWVVTDGDETYRVQEMRDSYACTCESALNACEHIMAAIVAGGDPLSDSAWLFQPATRHFGRGHSPRGQVLGDKRVQEESAQKKPLDEADDSESDLKQGVVTELHFAIPRESLTNAQLDKVYELGMGCMQKAQYAGLAGVIRAAHYVANDQVRPGVKSTYIIARNDGPEALVHCLPASAQSKEAPLPTFSCSFLSCRQTWPDEMACPHIMAVMIHNAT
jgi:hypothetical protein